MKHENNTDVAALFMRVVKVPRGYKVKVSWQNIVNPQNIYPCGVTEEIFISNHDMKYWKVFTIKNMTD